MDNLRGSLTPHATMRGVLGGREQLRGGLGVGGGTTDYEELENKPAINGVELIGDQSGHDLGLALLTDIQEAVNYSNTEQSTGVKWLDDKEIYQKTYSINVTSTNTQIALNITFDKIVKIDAIGMKTSGGYDLYFNTNYTDGGDWLNVQIYANNIRVLCSSWFVGALMDVTIYYTKN